MPTPSSSLVVLAALCACGSPKGAGGLALDTYPEARLATKADAARWALSSAPASAHWWGMASNIATRNFENGCPRVTRSGARLTLEGGCVDDYGKSWHGSATRDLDTSPDVFDDSGHLELYGFGYEFELPQPCNAVTMRERYVFDGELTLGGRKGMRSEVDADLVGESVEFDTRTCTVTEQAFAAEYHAVEIFNGDTDTWSGHGRLGNARDGVVSVETTNEVIDWFSTGTCNEPRSGSTVIRNRTDTLEIAYDGATDCDEKMTAKWSLNGQPMGELEGISR